MVIYEPNLLERKYGNAIGYKEEFTLSEWLLIPFDVIGIHQWEGQQLLWILNPLSLFLVFSFVLLAWKSFIKITFFSLVGIVDGLLLGPVLVILVNLLPNRVFRKNNS